jgi:hypothetical protein
LDRRVDIRHWYQACGGELELISETEVGAEHFTRMRRKGYVAATVDVNLPRSCGQLSAW